MMSLKYFVNSKVDIKANKHLRKLDVYSFESARKSPARILGIEEGIKKSLIGQTDHSIQRHYDNYNGPELSNTDGAAASF